VNLATRDFTVAHCTQYFPTARVSSGGRIRDFVPVQAQAREVLLGIHPGRTAGDFLCRFRFSLQASLWHYGPLGSTAAVKPSHDTLQGRSEFP